MTCNKGNDLATRCIIGQHLADEKRRAKEAKATATSARRRTDAIRAMLDFDRAEDMHIATCDECSRTKEVA